ncbi:MAG: sulfite oxidase [Chloroflexota bacterium]|nr:sulfite oxidase [Chloroflexota bacterium]
MSNDLVVLKTAPFNAESAIDRLAEEITPSPAFYVRSNFPVPVLDPEHHVVTVEGAVTRPLRLSIRDLRDLGTKTVATTMECAGNNRLSLAPLPSGEPWQGGAVSTGHWSGVPLIAVLEQARLRSEAAEILVEGADHGRPKDGPADIPFARSLPLDKACHPDTILALEMNGEPLPADHGAPVRLVVPQWYGMASVKWVARIMAITEPFTGYYQRQRYIYDYGNGGARVPVTAMHVKSVIVSPLDGAEMGSGRVVVRGQAWSGAGTVVRVEVAVDGGDTWQDARLLDAPSPYVWCAWEFQWDAAEPGRHALRSRATDSTGQRQPDTARWNKYGYGSNGVRPLSVYVQ